MRGSGLPSAVYVATELTEIQLALSAMGAADTAAVDLIEANPRQLLDVTADKEIYRGKAFRCAIQISGMGAGCRPNRLEPVLITVIARHGGPKAPPPQGIGGMRS